MDSWTTDESSGCMEHKPGPSLEAVHAGQWRLARRRIGKSVAKPCLLAVATLMKL